MNTAFHHYIAPRYWPTWFGLGLLRTLARLPLPVLAVLGTSIGHLLFLTIRSRRNIALTNLALCFPEKTDDERRGIARRSFCLAGQTLVSVGINWWGSPARLKRLIRYSGREHFDRACANQQNIILLAPHFVALEIAGLMLSSERPMTSMYQRANNKLADEFVRRGRSRFGGQMIERKSPLRELIKTIRRGLPFYYLPDQDAGRKGLFAPFFGVPTATIPTLGKFAHLGKAVVLPCYARILPYGQGWEIIIEPPLDIASDSDELAQTTSMNQCIEAAIRRMPEQYFWVHKRFKTRPSGEPSFYS